MNMIYTRQRLSDKLVWIAVGLMLAALAAIGFTLLESWKLEGGAAAINDMGSERMRSYRIAYLLSESLRSVTSDLKWREDLRAEMRRMEEVLAVLKQGDPARPLVMPRNAKIVGELEAVERQWREEIKPQVEEILTERDFAARQRMADNMHPRIVNFVGRIDGIVRAIERDNERNTSVLRWMQFALIALAVAGTVTLIFLMFLLVVRPVTTLQDGIQRMARGELDTRLPIETRDEFGELADGFNRMASHLQELYETLEERVAEKTRTLADKNRELAALYEVTALLNEQLSTETLCRGFIHRLVSLFDAQGGAVRLVDPKTQEIHLYVHEGLPVDFAAENQCLKMGECLCGEAAQSQHSVVEVFSRAGNAGATYRCQQAGFQTVSVFVIRFQRQSLGVFNLFHREPRSYGPQERQMLETLGQHLGVAIENQRLISRDKELAVSEERNLLAQELHDSIAQSLAFLNLQAQLLEDSIRRADLAETREILSQIREGIQESYEDVRELLVHFRTRIDHEDIELSIRKSLKRFEAQTGIKTSYKVAGRGVPLSPVQQLQVLHILHEALSNVRKHSHASRVELEILRNQGHAFRVRDNGCGFDSAMLEDETSSHIGLRIMKERARRIGGDIRIDSRPGQGTELFLTLPAMERVEAA